MKRLMPLILILALLMPTSAAAAPLARPALSVTVPNGGPTFWIHEVVRDDTVTIKVTNFPQQRYYRVEIGRIGNTFEPVEVGALDGSQGSDFLATFKIPNKFKGEQHLAIQIRRNSDNSRGYTIFANKSGFDSTSPISLTPVDQSHVQSVGTSVGIFEGPTFWIHDVDLNLLEFTLHFKYYEQIEKFKVLVGQNNSDFEGISVGLIEPSLGQEFSVTYQIPSRLLDAEEIKVRVENSYNGHSGSTAFTNVEDWSVVSPYGQYDDRYIDMLRNLSKIGLTPFTRVLNVVKDSEVTLQMYNFPADMDFTVSMGPQGTSGRGFVIGNQNTGSGGSFIATYPIPGQLRGLEVISIRLDSTTTKHFAYDSFENADGYSFGNTAVAFSGDWVLQDGTYPYTLIAGAIADTSVTINGFNFTKNDTYVVKMGPIGTQGVGGFQVGVLTTDNTGTFTETYTIPAVLIGSNQISIRFESVNTAYYAYDWFWNQPTP